MQWVAIPSSTLAAVCYLPDQSLLPVQFRSGDLYAYLMSRSEFMPNCWPRRPKAVTSMFLSAAAFAANHSAALPPPGKHLDPPAHLSS